MRTCLIEPGDEYPMPQQYEKSCVGLGRTLQLARGPEDRGQARTLRWREDQTIADRPGRYSWREDQRIADSTTLTTATTRPVIQPLEPLETMMAPIATPMATMPQVAMSLVRMRSTPNRRDSRPGSMLPAERLVSPGCLVSAGCFVSMAPSVAL